MDVAQYESQLSWNAATHWLHSLRFKAVADELRELDAASVLDIGCAGAVLFETLNARFDVDYTGVDADPECVAAANDRHSSNPNFRAICAPATECLDNRFDVIVSLETLEHMPADEVTAVIKRIAALRPQRFICSVPVEIGPSIWVKNLGSLACGYFRHSEYTWRETFYAGISRLDKLPPHHGTHKGFDWRWLTQTIRTHMRIVSLRKFPLQCLPPSLSTSVFIVAEPYTK